MTSPGDLVVMRTNYEDGEYPTTMIVFVCSVVKSRLIDDRVHRASSLTSALILTSEGQCGWFPTETLERVGTLVPWYVGTTPFNADFW